MKHIIYKHLLNLPGETTTVPIGTIIHFGEQLSAHYVWIDHIVEEQNVVVDSRYLIMLPTGQTFAPEDYGFDSMTHIQTLQSEFGQMVWHLYELNK